jgi:predicted permease
VKASLEGLPSRKIFTKLEVNHSDAFYGFADVVSGANVGRDPKPKLLLKHRASAIARVKIDIREGAMLGRTLFLLLGAVALLLVIGCANVSILLLARGTARQHELAIRATIGSSRVRIVRQLLTEALALSLGGALLGVALTYGSLSLIVAWLPEFSFPHEAAIRMNLPVLAFSVALALLTGILFGLSPSLHFSRPELSQIMQASARKLTAGVPGKRTHDILVGSQIALTLILLTAAAGAMAGFLTLMHTSLGYDPHNAMSVGVPVHDNTFKTWEERSAYFDQLLQKIASMPEIVTAGISTNATPPSNGNDRKFEILGGSARAQEQIRENLISPEYFSVLHIPLLQGKLWDRTETMRGARVAVINDSMARKFWPKGDALGQQIRLPEIKAEPPFTVVAPDADSWLRIIGIVADARDDGLRNPIKAAVYVPFTLEMRMWTQILVRTHVAPLTVLHSIRVGVQKVNAEQQVFHNPRDLEHWITTQREVGTGAIRGDAVWNVLHLGSGACGDRSLQCCFLWCRAENERVRHPHGSGREPDRSVAPGLLLHGDQRGRRLGCRRTAQPRPGQADYELGGGEFARSADPARSGCSTGAGFLIG